MQHAMILLNLLILLFFRHNSNYYGERVKCRKMFVISFFVKYCGKLWFAFQYVFRMELNSMLLDIMAFSGV